MAIRHHIKVLIVDDDPQVCKAIGAILQESDYQVQTCTQGRAGLQASRKTSFDIALIDIMMPDLDGIELIQRIKAEDSRIALVLMTAAPDLPTATEAMRLGARDYIAKPFQQDQLLTAIERLAREMGLIYTQEQELNRLIGQRIRQERLKQDLTLRQLSERSDLTTSQLSQVELGKNAASVWALARIGGALGKQLSQLLEGL